MLRRNGPVVKSVESVLRLEGSLWGERFVEEVGLEPGVKERALPTICQNRANNSCKFFVQLKLFYIGPRYLAMLGMKVEHDIGDAFLQSWQSFSFNFCHRVTFIVLKFLLERLYHVTL